MTRGRDKTPTDDRAAPGVRASFQAVAARIGNLATNVLVTGVILIVGTVFGRDVITWWRSDSSASVTPPLTAVVGGPVSVGSATRHLLEFGDFPFVLSREQFVGDEREVLAELRLACRESIDGSPLTSDLSPAEQRMLVATDRLTPIEARANIWSIFQIDRPLPMVVGVRTFDPQVATAKRRVVSWGLAVPDATPEVEQQLEWTLFGYSADTTSGPTPDGVVRPAPPGGRRILSLRTDQGDAVVGYAGTGTVVSWTCFYDELFAAQPSPTGDDWQVASRTWRRRYRDVESAAVDVVIHSDGEEQLRSLVITSTFESLAR